MECPYRANPLSHRFPRALPSASAPESARELQGASPCRAYALRPVTDCNSAAARQGGEQQEVNDWSAKPKGLNSIRPDATASLLAKDEAQTHASGTTVELKGSVQKRRRGASGGWRRNGWKFL